MKNLWYFTAWNCHIADNESRYYVPSSRPQLKNRQTDDPDRSDWITAQINSIKNVKYQRRLKMRIKARILKKSNESVAFSLSLTTGFLSFLFLSFLFSIKKKLEGSFDQIYDSYANTKNHWTIQRECFFVVYHFIGVSTLNPSTDCISQDNRYKIP